MQKRLISIGTVFIITLGVIIISRNQGGGVVCLANDVDVAAVTLAMQNWYRDNGRFPNQNSFDPNDSVSPKTDEATVLEQIALSHDVSSYSNASESEFFVYLKRNCKIQIKPKTIAVFPK